MRFEEGEEDEDEDDDSEDGEGNDDNDNVKCWGANFSEGEPEGGCDSEAETEDIEVYTSSNCDENEGVEAEDDAIIEFTASV